MAVWTWPAKDKDLCLAAGTAIGIMAAEVQKLASIVTAKDTEIEDKDKEIGIMAAEVQKLASIVTAKDTEIGCVLLHEIDTYADKRNVMLGL